jgi:hypothetical protein
MTTQSAIGTVLGILLGVVSGSTAFLVVRVVPVIWQRTGASGWIKRRTGIDILGSALVAAAWIARSWFLWFILVLFWQAILAPPVSYMVFRFLFLPGSLAAAGAPPLTLGFIVSYASYALCAYAYWNAWRKARQMRA